MINLEFLDQHAAAKEFTHSNYLTRMSNGELNVRLSYFYSGVTASSLPTCNLRERLLNVYLNSLNNFDSQEMTSLQVHFDFIQEQIERRGGKPFFFPDSQTIKLIKLDDRGRKLDWGYLYTINNTVVISKTYLDQLVNNTIKYQRSLDLLGAPSTAVRPVASNRNLLLSGANDLYHEMVHILQRNGGTCIGFGPGSSNVHSKFFETMYCNYWKFITLKPGQIKGKKCFQKRYTTITNPDGGNWEYLVDLVINGRHRFLTPVLVYNFKELRPVTIMVELERTESSSYRLTDVVYQTKDYRVKGYLDRFPGCLTQLDHPNEISAQVISNYLILDQIDDNDWTNFPFYQYLNRFVRSC